jgi:solute carrier family 25 protein 38
MVKRMNDGGASTTTTINNNKSKSTTKKDSPSENNKSSGGGWNPSSFVGGASAGLVASATLQPFEVIKTRMQVPGGQGGANNIFSTASRVVRTQGVLALWSGVSASCIRTTAGAGLYFFVLDKMQKEVKQWQKKKYANGEKKQSEFENSVQTFMVGAVSRASIATLLNPISVVKTRLEYGGGPEYKRSVGRMLVDITKKEGAKGLFSGIVPTILRDAPFSGLNLLVFMKAREFTASLAEKQGREVSSYDTLLCGAFAGGFATFLTQPPDVLRTRLQIQRNLDRNIKPMVTFSSILAEKGLRGLYVGAVPRIARRTFQQAITWSLFEFVSKQLGGTGSENWKK